MIFLYILTPVNLCTLRTIYNYCNTYTPFNARFFSPCLSTSPSTETISSYIFCWISGLRARLQARNDREAAVVSYPAKKNSKQLAIISFEVKPVNNSENYAYKCNCRIKKKGEGAVKYLKYEINKEVKIKTQKLSYI